jgi:hypothetical protein
MYIYTYIGGTLGQGANSALMDVVALDACLDETKDDLNEALHLFSKRQVPEGLGLWKLLQLPGKGPLGIMYRISQAIKTIVSKLIEIFRIPLPQGIKNHLMTTQNSLSKTNIPFSEIVRMNKFWINAATSKYTKIEYEAETGR